MDGLEEVGGDWEIEEREGGNLRVRARAHGPRMATATTTVARASNLSQLPPPPPPPPTPPPLPSSPQTGRSRDRCLQAGFSAGCLQPTPATRSASPKHPTYKEQTGTVDVFHFPFFLFSSSTTSALGFFLAFTTNNFFDTHRPTHSHL
jgi:hypothetical protein